MDRTDRPAARHSRCDRRSVPLIDSLRLLSCGAICGAIPRAVGHGLTVTDWREIGAARGPDHRRRCGWCLSAPDYVAYQRREWGRPVTTDDVRLYEKLVPRVPIGAVVAARSLRVTVPRHDAGFDLPEESRLGKAHVEHRCAATAIVASTRRSGGRSPTSGHARSTRSPWSLAAMVWDFEPHHRGRQVPGHLGDLAGRPRRVQGTGGRRCVRHGFRFVGPDDRLRSHGVPPGRSTTTSRGCHRVACNKDRQATDAPRSATGS